MNNLLVIQEIVHNCKTRYDKIVILSTLVMPQFHYFKK